MARKSDNSNMVLASRHPKAMKYGPAICLGEGPRPGIFHAVEQLIMGSRETTSMSITRILIRYFLGDRLPTVIPYASKLMKNGLSVHLNAADPD
jgi:hypothetical protein